ncbi:MAG: DUF6116 family protein [Acidimicrobiia bacterium]|jgi:hypothetical protein
MDTPTRGLVGAVSTWAQGRRYPTLLAVTAALFAVDVVVPDLVPLVDELLLGLATVALARWKADRRTGVQGEPPAVH